MASTKSNFGKDDIIDAVEALVTKQGVNSFSLKDVAKMAGISQGTLYYHYKSKDALILDLMKRHMNQLKGEFDSWLIRHQDGSATETHFLEVIFYKGVKLFNKAKIHIYLINECLSSSAILKKEYISLWNEWKETLETGIKRFFPHIKDPSAMAYLLMLVVDGLTVQEALEEDPKEKQEITALLAKSMKEN